MNIGLLILRVVVGTLLIGHGLQKLFGLFGGRGPEGTGALFETLGYQPGPAMARFAGMGETGAGVSIALGLITPVGAAALIGVMVNAIGALHWRRGPWVTNGGYEYQLVLLSVATMLAFVGPGTLSLDWAAGWYLAGAGWGSASLVIGGVSGWFVLASRRPAAQAERGRRAA